MLGVRSRERVDRPRGSSRIYLYTRVRMCTRVHRTYSYEMRTEIRRLITKNIVSAMENRKIFLKPINIRKIVLISIFSFPENTYISQKIFFVRIFKVLIILYM